MRHARPARPTGTITFVFTDIEGSTRLWQDRGDLMGAALARHDAILSEGMVAGSGYVFKRAGDAFCVAFATADEALLAAIACQRALVTEAWPEGCAPRIRMALHTGTAELRGGDYFGVALSRVARILEIAHGGQILISQAVFALLGEPRQIRPLGACRLRDLYTPEYLFQVTAPDLPDTFKAPPSLDALPNNLPRQLTRFVGREQEIKEIMRLLTPADAAPISRAEGQATPESRADELEPKGVHAGGLETEGLEAEGLKTPTSHLPGEAAAAPRLLTLTGAAGSGKTRLALQAAARLLGAFPDGVWLVEMASLSDPALVNARIASVVARRSVPLPAHTLRDFLASKRMLLVLDNCEHLAAVCAVCTRDLLSACPGLHILATSQQALGCLGEMVWRVPPLSLPLREPASLAELMQSEAVRLFVERARFSQPDFQVSMQEAPFLLEICRRLDGLPLALTLAAAWTPLLSLEQIAARLRSDYDLLVSRIPGEANRYSALRIALDWSHDLLTEPERVLLRRLSVFAGSFDLEAVENVCLTPPLDAVQALPLLARLLDTSWIGSLTAARPPRYRLMESMRQYGATRLEQAGETDEMRLRHLRWCLGWAEKAEQEISETRQEVWLTRWERDRDNVRAALAFSRDHPSEAGSGLLLASRLWRYWSARGAAREGREWLETFLQATPDIALDIQANALNALGNLAFAQCQYAATEQAYTTCLAMRRAAGNNAQIALSLNNLGVLARLQGRYAQARAFYAEAQALLPSDAAPQSRGQLLNNLGNVASDEGQWMEAEALYRQSLQLREQSGDMRGAAATLCGLADAARLQGRYEEACGLAEQCLAAFERLGDRSGAAMALYSLAAAQFRGGADGSASLARSIVLHKELEDARGSALCLKLLAADDERRGDWETAAWRLAASEAARLRLDFALPPSERSEYARLVEAIQNALGDRFTSVWNAGSALTMPQAFALSAPN